MSKTNNPQIEGLILISPADVIGLVTIPDEVEANQVFINEAKQLVSAGKENQLLDNLLWGSDRLSAKTYLNFFDKGAKTAIFNFWNPALGWEVVNSIKSPVIAFTGTKDLAITPIIDPYKAMELLESQLINSPRKKTIVYEGAAHDFSGFGEKITKEVIKYINNK
jgi:hypothetical protein